MNFSKNISGVMTKFKIHELSGVDRPAQAGARAVIMKRDGEMAIDPIIKREFSDDKRKELAESGAALPDGSFPIETKGDLENAVQAFGRAKDKPKAKAHIISRAKTLGATGSLPDGWVSDAVKDDGESGGVEMSAELKKAYGLPATATDGELITAMAKAQKESMEETEKAKKEAADAKEKADKATRKASMTDEEKDHTSGMSDADSDAFMQKPEADRKNAIAAAKKGDESFVSKGVTIRKSVVGEGVFQLLKSQAEDISALAAGIAKANGDAETAKFAKMAVTEYAHIAGTPEERALVLKNIHAITDDKAREAALSVLKAAEGAGKFAFSRVGTGGGQAPAGGGNTAGEIDKLAKEYQKTHPTVSFEKAYSEVIAENPGLYAKAEQERKAFAKQHSGLDGE